MMNKITPNCEYTTVYDSYDHASRSVACSYDHCIGAVTIILPENKTTISLILHIYLVFCLVTNGDKLHIYIVCKLYVSPWHASKLSQSDPARIHLRRRPPSCMIVKFCHDRNCFPTVYKAIADAFVTIVTSSRIGNSYDQAHFTTNQNGGRRRRLVQISRIVSKRHLVRHPYCTVRESWDPLIFWVWKPTAARSNIADFRGENIRRIDRNCHALLIVTAFQSQHLLIVTCLNES